MPFMVKLKGQKEGLIYTPPFNTQLAHALIVGIWNGGLDSPQAIASRLDELRMAVKVRPD